jgi:hypothetical protein
MICSESGAAEMRLIDVDGRYEAFRQAIKIVKDGVRNE